MHDVGSAKLRQTAYRLVVALFSMALLTSAGTLSWAGDWPQFLGPQRTGISDETGLIDSWPEGGLTEVFRVTGGVGMSGISIQAGKLVTLVQRDGKQIAVCLNAKTGQTIWATELAPEYENAMGNGPRATPAFHGKRVLFFTGEGILACLNQENGSIEWSQHVVKELGGKEADYGMSSSPIISGDSVIVTAGCPGGALAAFDIETGKLTWKVGDERAGYSSPALLTVAGESQLVAFTGTALVGIDAGQGTLKWRYPFETDYDCNIVTPIQIGEDIFISSGENHGSVRLAVKKQGNEFDVTEVWSSLGRKSVMRNEWQTAIQKGDYLFGFDNVGSAGPITHLTCISAKNGERVWQESRFGKGNMIMADGKLLATTMDGEFVLLEANPESFREIGRVELMGMTRQAPALANGLVYLRDDADIICLDLRKTK